MLGVDPGLSRCGYCGLRVRGRESQPVALGVFRTDRADPVPVRLATLAADVRALLDELRPDVVALERVLFQVNVRTAMAVGQASGVVMAEAAAAGAEVIEYSPNQVKEAVTGWGAAPKLQVQEMVQVLLGLDRRPEPPDAADAAAVALCHAAMAPVAARRHDVDGDLVGLVRNRVRLGGARQDPRPARPGAPA